MASDSDEDDFVVLGTPLEPLNEEDGRRKPVQVHDLPVKDKQGRIRFHGAFTGGFSAGYFNTVGSKEGWTPSTFQSSRAAFGRSEGSKQRAEDFMDDEDLGEFGIAPRQLKTSSDYVSKEPSRKRPLPEHSSLLEHTLTNLIVPEKTSIGIRLLRKLGWKEGQGIGPRISKKAKSKGSQGAAKVYGCSLPGASKDEDSSSDEEYPDGVTFAPKDVCPISFTAKDDVHGIGYSGINVSTALPSLATYNRGVSKGRGRSIRGQAFGVGALEDDDDDIYGVDQLSNYDMTMDMEESNTSKLYGWTAPKGKRPTSIQEPGANYIGAALEGFHITSKPCTLTKVFPPPKIPRDFRPMHVFMDQPQTTTSQTRLDRLNPISRGLIIGETPHLKSVFELVSSTDQQRLKPTTQTSTNIQTTVATSNLPTHLPTLNTPSSAQFAESIPRKEPQPITPSTSFGQPDSKFSSSSTFGPQFSGSSRPTGLKDVIPVTENVKPHLKPFAKNPLKQARYEKYNLLVSQGNKDPYAQVVAGHMTEWEREQEQKEFERAVKLYRPLSGMMSNRFTAGRFDDDPNSIEISEDKMNSLSDLDKAVEMKMFGRLTREVHEWHPHKTLCKRFNVPYPYPGSSTVGLTSVRRDKMSVFNFLNFSDQPKKDMPPKQPPKAIEAPPRKEETIAKPNIFLAYFQAEDEKKKNQQQCGNQSTVSQDTNEKQTTDEKLQTESLANIEQRSLDQPMSDSDTISEQTTEGERPPMDLFKAIFADSDSDASSDEAQPETALAILESSERAASQSLQTTSQPPEPIASSDYTTLEASPKIMFQSSSIPQTRDSFGPSLPSSVQFNKNVNNQSSGDVQLTKNTNQFPRDYVPLDKTAHKHRSETHRKHKRRKMDKHKHKKDKKKKNKKEKATKKKRHKKRPSSSSSGSEADSDDSEPSDSELLQRLKSAAKKNISLSDLIL